MNLSQREVRATKLEISKKLYIQLFQRVTKWQKKC